MEIIEPRAQHTHTVIFLHGRGSNASEFVADFFESQASDERCLQDIFPQIRWVLPTSGNLWTRKFGNLSQWYDMRDIDNPAESEADQQQHIDSAVNRVLELVNQEAAVLVDLKKIILAGISQGCAVAIQALLKQDSQLGGFIGLSSWLPSALPLMHVAECVQRTPIFLSHSDDDDVIAIKYGKGLHDTLKNKKMSVEWHQYGHGGHWVNEPQGIGKLLFQLDMAITLYLTISRRHCGLS